MFEGLGNFFIGFHIGSLPTAFAFLGAKRRASPIVRSQRKILCCVEPQLPVASLRPQLKLANLFSSGRRRARPRAKKRQKGDVAPAAFRRLGENKPAEIPHYFEWAESQASASSNEKEYSCSATPDRILERSATFMM